MVIQEDDAASVASDASTVVPDHHGSPHQLDADVADSQAAPPPQPQQLEWGEAAEQAAEPAELPDACAAAPGGGAAAVVGLRTACMHQLAC